MDIITLRIVILFLAVISFLLITFWAFAPKNKEKFEKIAKEAIDYTGRP